MKKIIPILILIFLWNTDLFAQAATDLFFSEYVEGSGNNKALEIYNKTGTDIDLAAGNYVIHISRNGGTSTRDIFLAGTVLDGDVFVFAKSSADQAIIDQADQTAGGALFNGDDAITLLKGGPAGTLLDSIGQVGTDPGNEWGIGLLSTQNNTIRRKDNVCQGDLNSQDSFDPSLEFDGFPTDTFDGLGSHSSNCVSPPPPLSPQWNTNSSGIYYDRGNVGIGTTGPSQRLDVRGNAAGNDGITIENLGAGNPQVRFLENGAEVAAMTWDKGSNTLHFRDGTGNILNIKSGNVGIGTTSALAKLDVNGGIKIGTDSAPCNASKAGTIRWTGSDFEGCKGGSQWVSLSFSADNFSCGTDTIIDNDANSYNTVLIGIQCWMKENLKVGAQINGSTSQTDDGIVEKWCYDNDSANCTTEGALYAWDEAMGYVTTESTQGICPSGWHIPADVEWYTLETFLATGSCLSSREGVWDCSPTGTNILTGGSSGFDASYSGFVSSGTFQNIGANAFFMTSSDDGSATAKWERWLDPARTGVFRTKQNKSALIGKSIRCVRD